MRRRIVLSAVALTVLLVGSGILVVRTRARSADGDARVDRVPGAESPPRRDPKRNRQTVIADEAADSRIVRGTVKDKDGAPISDAEVAALDGYPSGHERILGTTRSAANGTYELSIREGGDSIYIVGRKDGFAPQGQWAQGGETDLVLNSGALRELLVVDPHGDAVADAGITLEGRSGPILVPTAFTRTDARGRARVVAEDKAFVVVRAHGFAFASADVAGPGDRDGVHRIELREGRTISGVAVDDGGKPLADIDVELRGWGDCSEYYADDDRRTGPDGTFLFDGLGADPTETPWRLSIGAESLTATPVFATPGRSDVRLVVHRAGVVRGVVAYPDGKPPSHCSIDYAGESGDAFTDGDGKFELSGVPPGRKSIAARAFSPEGLNVGWLGTAVVDVPEGGKVEGVRITVAPDPSTSFVFARVVDADGNPQPWADVKAWRDGVDVGAGFQFDPRGLVFLDVPPGTPVVVTAHLYTETVSGSARTDSPVSTSAVPPSQPFELRLGPLGTLRLHIVDPEGHDIALARAAIDAESKPQPDGTYPLAADTTFKATVRVPGFADQSIEFAPPQPPTRDETVRLLRATRVVGRVFGADGRAAPSSVTAHIAILTDGRETDSADVSPDDDGRFVVDSLPPGHAKLVVKAGDDVMAYREFDLKVGAATDLGDIALPELTTLRFQVLDRDEHPVGGAQATFLDPSGGAVRPATTSRTDGTFDLVAPNGFPVRVLVKRSGLATQFVDPAFEGAQPQRVVLASAGAVHVCAAAVPDVGDLHVEAAAPAGSSRRWRPSAAGGEGSDGLRSTEGVVYDDLPPGPVAIVLVTPRRRVVRTVEVVAGKTVDCLFGN